MLASLGPARLDDERVAYERKYDGIRALIAIEPKNAAGIRIWSRLGNEKTAQFPDVVQALARFARTLKAPVLLDGEIVAIDDDGEPTGFQRIQGRIHGDTSSKKRQPVTFIAFDVLRDGNEDRRRLPLNP